ncbi:MAG: SDR family NAD(P)-dependent oxidoreductase [Burkholderiales bacterium]|nr:SDR family NAD(P)-dependent oxidoreductase [Burkholderiales bacterium]
MKAALIFGASRGIGHEFVRQYRADGWRVLATCRKAADVEALQALGAEVHLLDVTDADGVITLAGKLAAERFDVIVINAGVFPRGDDKPDALDEASFLNGMRTNVLAPQRLIGLFGDHLNASATLGVLSSQMGSIGRTEGSNAMFYRATKAAVNMVIKAYANAWQDGNKRILALHPGWVKTDMGGAGAEIEVATSVSGLRRVIAAGGMERNGGFFDYADEALEW